MIGSASLLDQPPQASGKPLLAGLGAVGVHAALLAIATGLGARLAHEVAKPALVSQIVEIEAAPEKPTETPPRVDPIPTAHPISRNERRDAPATAAAQAGRVLATADDVVDFGDSFVVGKGDDYAGGVTETNGTASHAVSDVQARGGGGLGGAGTGGVDSNRSRAPQLADGSRWDCPFPEEAEDAGLDHALVTLRIEVAADGHVLQASATRDPGHGFGREARRCALRKRWTPGLDHRGHAAIAVVNANVRFDRE